MGWSGLRINTAPVRCPSRPGKDPVLARREVPEPRLCPAGPAGEEGGGGQDSGADGQGEDQQRHPRGEELERDTQSQDRLAGEVHADATRTISPMIVGASPAEISLEADHRVVVVCTSTPAPKFRKIAKPVNAAEGW